MPSGSVLSVAMVAGAATGVVTPVAGLDLLAAALCAAALALLVAERRGLAAPLGVVALAAAAACEAALARDRALAPPIVKWHEAVAGDVVDVAGTLAADAAPAEGGVRLLIDVAQVRDATGWHRAPGRVQAHVAGAMATEARPAWTAGRRIRAPVSLKVPASYLNPGGPSLRWQALRRPFDLTGAVKSAALVEVERGAWWDEAAAAVRRRVRAAAQTLIAPRSAQAAAIVTAILIGDRAGLTDEVQRRLQSSGTYHVIAISGGNVALLTALCFAALRLILRSPRLPSVITILAVVSYGGIVGGDASVTRAVVAACVYLGAGLAGLVPRAIHVLATVAAVVVIADPLAVIDVGAWLSFGATLGIIVFAGRAANGIARARSQATRSSHVVRAARALARAAVALFAASLAAELALMPISAAVFSRVTVAGLALNFIAIPAMALVQIAGLFTVALSGWWTAGATATAAVAQFAADRLVSSSGLVDIAPWLSWRAPPVAIGWTLAYYAAVAIALRAGRPAARRIAAVVAAISLAVIVTAPGLERHAPVAGRLRLTMVDVGQGDALIAQFPSGHSMIVDTGGTPGPFDIGGRIVTPTAWARGVRRLDWLVLTHGDQDHAGGAASVVSDLAPREIWEGVPVPRHEALRRLRDDARARGTIWRFVRAGRALELGGVTVRARHPPSPEWERQKVRNDDSIVLELQYGDVALLLTGDAGAEFERTVTMESGLPPLRILKVGHHGSRTSTSDQFVETYQPQIALVSVGGGNLFGHPSADVLARLDRAGAQIFRTDRDGAITVETDGRVVQVQTMGGRSWTLTVTRTPS